MTLPCRTPTTTPVLAHPRDVVTYFELWAWKFDTKQRIVVSTFSGEVSDAEIWGLASLIRSHPDFNPSFSDNLHLRAATTLQMATDPGSSRPAAVSTWRQAPIRARTDARNVESQSRKWQHRLSLPAKARRSGPTRRGFRR